MPSGQDRIRQALAFADERRQQEGTRGAIFNINAVRENPELADYPQYKPYRGMEKDQLALVDRYTHGAGFAEDLPQARLGWFDPVGWAGAGAAVLGGVGNEALKALGREDVAGSISSVAGDEAQGRSQEYKPGVTSSASPWNPYALLRGYADARWGDEDEKAIAQRRLLASRMGEKGEGA